MHAPGSRLGQGPARKLRQGVLELRNVRFPNAPGDCDMDRLAHFLGQTCLVGGLLRHDLRFHRRLRRVVNHRVGVFDAHAVGAALLL